MSMFEAENRGGYESPHDLFDDAEPQIGTKIGRWPSWIQSGHEGGGFVFQIGTVRNWT